MRLLITGGAGFIGSHFIRFWLRRHPSDEVVNVDQLGYAGSLERLTDVESQPGYRFVRGDICDSDAVHTLMQGVDGVVHFAAQTHVDRSITDASPFLRTNVEGTGVLLLQAHAQAVRRFIHVSTDEVYGPVLDGAVDERAALSPRSPYAASKAAGDMLAQSFFHTYGLGVIVVRPTNIFGPGQLPEKLIPLCLTHAYEGRPIPIYGDGLQRRAWLFVDDLCDAIERIMEQGSAGSIYNVASSQERTNLETVRRILQLVDRSTDLIQFVMDRPGHDRRYAMDDRALRLLGWQAETSFEEGLSRTVKWYWQHAEWWRPIVQALRENPYHWLNRPFGSGSVQTSGAVV